MLDPTFWFPLTMDLGDFDVMIVGGGQHWGHDNPIRIARSC